MELRDALTQIAEIRQQMARGQVFRGYRSATTAFSAGVALVASAVQARCLPDSPHGGLYVWLAAAVLSLSVVGAEMLLRYRRSASALERETTMLAIEQFAPCLVAGALMTYVIDAYAGGSLSMLPGLWAMLFGLGIFASRRVLPRGTFVVGAYYLLAGALCITQHGHGEFEVRIFAGQMAVTFGGGQLLAAGLLYWMLERQHGRS